MGVSENHDFAHKLWLVSDGKLRTNLWMERAFHKDPQPQNPIPINSICYWQTYLYIWWVKHLSSDDSDGLHAETIEAWIYTMSMRIYF